MSKRFDLDSKATEYLMSILKGDSVLSPIILDSGSCHTWLPAETPAESMYKFDSSFVTTEPASSIRLNMGPIAGKYIKIQNLDHLLVSEIHNFLKKTDKNVVFILDAMARKGDPLNPEKSNWVVALDRIFHYLQGSNEMTSDSIADVLREAKTSLNFVGFGTVLHESKKIEPVEIDLSVLDKLWVECSFVFVGAYDGEGFLIWKRD